MSIEEILEVIRAFFEALKRILAAFQDKDYPESESQG